MPTAEGALSAGQASVRRSHLEQWRRYTASRGGSQAETPLTKEEEAKLCRQDEVWRATIWRKTQFENRDAWPATEFVGPRDERAATNDEWKTSLVIWG